MVALESGSTTGSDMGVIMMGSMNSSGTPPSLEEQLPPRQKPWPACSCRTVHDSLLKLRLPRCCLRASHVQRAMLLPNNNPHV